MGILNFREEQEYENVNRSNSQIDALSVNPYLVYVKNQGKVLEENNADEVFSTASLAKLFTVLYTLENVDMDFKVRVGDEIYLAGQNSSLAGITEGVYTIRDLIKAAIVPSGNDAAYALAKATLDEVKKRDIPPSELNDVFKAEIQKFLKNNGFDSTHLVDPAGYDEANTSNVNDILKAINKLYIYKIK